MCNHFCKIHAKRCDLGHWSADNPPSVRSIIEHWHWWSPNNCQWQTGNNEQDYEMKDLSEEELMLMQSCKLKNDLTKSDADFINERLAKDYLKKLRKNIGKTLV